MKLSRGNGSWFTVHGSRERILRRGFTIIELMVVMTVISILATMALYGLNKSQAAARDAQRQQIMTGLQGTFERFYGDWQRYPIGNSCQDLCSVINGLMAGTSPYLSSVPIDPGTKTTICNDSTLACSGANPTCKGAVYTYTCSNTATFPQSYVLTLTKESGGSSVFNSPQ